MKESFFIIKPDGLKNEQIHQYIFSQIQDRNIIICKRVKMRFTAHEIDMFWPQTKKSDVLNGLLKCYLTSDESEILFVKGYFNDDLLNQIKKNVRRKYEICKFSNCIHAPADENERIQQLQYIKNRSLIEDTGNDINVTAINMWKQIKELGWHHDFSNCSNKHYILYLQNDESNTIDYVARTIYETTDIYSLEAAYILTIQADMKGCIPLVGFENKNEFERIKRKFDESNVHVNSNIVNSNI